MTHCATEGSAHIVSVVAHNQLECMSCLTSGMKLAALNSSGIVSVISIDDIFPFPACIGRRAARLGAAALTEPQLYKIAAITLNRIVYGQRRSDTTNGSGNIALEKMQQRLKPAAMNEWKTGLRGPSGGRRSAARSMRAGTVGTAAALPPLDAKKGG